MAHFTDEVMEPAWGSRTFSHSQSCRGRAWPKPGMKRILRLVVWPPPRAGTRAAPFPGVVRPPGYGQAQAVQPWQKLGVQTETPVPWARGGGPGPGTLALWLQGEAHRCWNPGARAVLAEVKSEADIPSMFQPDPDTRYGRTPLARGIVLWML